ncbi:MAG: peptidase M50 [Actinobacteria bacterium]|nr:peptidase M50 [Actinomycetota bacterium]
MTAATAPPRGWRLGSLAGVPVYLGRSWVIVAAAITLLFGPLVGDLVPDTGAGGYVVAFGFAVLLLFSVLVHEAAHAVTARFCGYQVNRIVADFWGGHTAYDAAGSTPGRAALVAISGPLANLALAGVGWPLTLAVSDGLPWLLLTAFTSANAFVAAFNLLPGLPLDGGFLVDSLVWKVTGSRGTGTLVAGWCGRLLVLGLAWWVVGVPILTGGSISLTRVLWAALIGAFIWVGAGSAVRAGRARRTFENVTVGAVWRPVSSVAEDTPVDRVAWGRGLWLTTDAHGIPTGLVDTEALQAVPPGASAQTRVAAVAQRQPPGWVVDARPDDAVTDVVLAMQTHRTPVVAVRLPDGSVPAIVLAADL